jgi:hypothetical protein
MTIPSTSRRAGPYSGNDTATSFAFNFKVFTADDILVTLANSAGVATELVLDTDYSVTLNSDQETSPGGTITYPLSGDPLATGETLAITGNSDYEQELDLPSGGNFPPIAIENQFDRIVMQIQQLVELLNRTLVIPATSDASGAMPTPVADSFFAWNGTADAVVLREMEDMSGAVSFLQDGLGAVSRLLQAKMRDALHVKDFGVVGDRTTDDTDMLQTALNAMEGTRRYLDTSGCEIRLTSRVTVPTGTGLIGTGVLVPVASGFDNENPQTHYTDSSCVLDLSGETSGAYTASADQIVAGIGIEWEYDEVETYTGDGADVTFTVGYYFRDDSELIVKVNGTLKVLTTDYSVTGEGSLSGGELTFVAAPANGATITIARGGQAVDMLVARNCENLLISGTEIWNFPLGAGIKAASLSGHSRIIGNHVHDGGNNTIWTGYSPTITNADVNLYGIDLDDDRVNSVKSKGVLIVFNRVEDINHGALAKTTYGNQADGIGLQNGTLHNVLCNYVRNVNEGIDAFATHCNILHNVFEDNSGWGIKLIHGAAYNLVAHNRVYDAGFSSIAVVGGLVALGDTQRNTISHNYLIGVDPDGVNGGSTTTACIAVFDGGAVAPYGGHALNNTFEGNVCDPGTNGEYVFYTAAPDDNTGNRFIRNQPVAEGATGRWVTSTSWATSVPYLHVVQDFPTAAKAYISANQTIPQQAATIVITGITKASPGVVTYVGTDPANGDSFLLSSVNGMTELDDALVLVSNVNAGANTFELTRAVDGTAINTTSFGTYLTLTITNITQANPAVVTYTGTDPANGDDFYISSVGGMTQVNARTLRVANVNAGANTFELTTTAGVNVDSTGYSAYTSGGVASAVATPSWHVANFDGDLIDTLSELNADTGWVCSDPGRYRVEAIVRMSSVTNFEVAILQYQGGVTDLAPSIAPRLIRSSTATDESISVDDIVECGPGDLIVVGVKHGYAGSRTLTGGNQDTMLSVTPA